MIDVNCVPCLRKQATRLFEKYKIAEERQIVLKGVFEDFLQNDGLNQPSPLSTQFLNKLVREETGINDLYFEEKEFYNKVLLDRYEQLKNDVLSSDNPLKTALRYALAGNIIDFGPPHKFDLDSTFSEALDKKIGIDHSDELFRDLEVARTVLYLGDNAGEIVTDKLFIETLNHPNVVFAVRGNPVLNDVTVYEAEAVGMHEVARVVDNGFDAPSTLTDYCSAEFLEIFNKADVIISKGQGNFEGLYGQVDHKKLYFLFMVKCDEIAKATGRLKNEAVVLKNE
ncbi:DUF89 domain-containing protein [Marinilabilia salmonicolor]|uniref:Damage-control phosphatase ARMT1-like metal-binding domain-containing protein n=1 Tax=Marinilabilia salmonicolor TaxID=989 RepID=A0A368V195_9BACT|nr:ARMT1-like domain-containing protein [Marinilabilia salmonicolor]RCW34573.1 hypothetical protein DFO77_11174 [Marinilabilia salmonicolor]